jgi:5'-3' exonuclease
MNKTNLVFDFSNMAMRALFTCSYANAGEVTTFDTDHECGILIRKIAMDMAYVTRMFTPDRVIVACDARDPWRRSLYDNIEGESYKGNRQKDTTKNWTKIFTELNNYKEILKKQNFVVTELPNAEADDLAALWKRESFNNGDNVILVSSDKDWSQLVEYNGKNFCLCFNPISNNKGKKKLYTTADCLEWINGTNQKLDIFFTNYNAYKDTLANIKTKDSKVEYEIINADMVLLDKIMCGDDGDNAPTIYEYYKNGKKVRMTPSRCKKILESLNIETIKDLCEASAAGALLPALSASFKKEIDDIDIDERVMRQRMLVELNPDLFPHDIVATFTYHVKDSDAVGYIDTTSINLETILKDSKFLDENYKNAGPKEAGIFDNIKNLEKYIPELSATGSVTMTNTLF